METFELDPQDFTPGDNRKGDEHLAIRFFRKAARDDVASAADGTMRVKEVEMIQIMVPGDRDNIIIRPAGPGDLRRFGKQYDDWKRNESSEQLSGTPLEMWGRLTLSQVEEYRYLGVRSVEQLAALADATCLKLPGSQDLKRKAAAYLEVQKDEAPLRKVQAELEQRDQLIAEMSQRLNALEAKPQPQANNRR
jgi:bifunctional DNA-binding transcriptional regulator/antitoxin component of YhaV-PrlF toxin-antitoxin module